MSLNAGKCAFTGQAIPIASGIRYVAANGNTTLYSRRRYNKYIKDGSKPQNFPYTFLSRLFHKKGENVSKEKMVKIKTEKIERGYAALPKEVAERLLTKKQ